MIEISNLCKTYGSLTALHNLNLSIRPGELFCFLGPNGAGKTTTIKILTGLVRASSGTAMINGTDIQSDPVGIKRQIGYIPDTPYMYERLTVTEFFLFYGELFDVPTDRIATEMDINFTRFGLQEHRHALVKELSHGLRQRLIYATTFLHNPRIMLIDEPFVGLDPYTIRLIKDLLRAHTRHGGTILLTTHILAIAEDIADRIGIINRGEMVAVGTLAELQQQHSGKSLEDIFLNLTRPDGGTTCHP
ncbi:MAG TPA: ABC transporter [Verrucomicrobia bacterium]|nr:ABC transporter [Verrucomicrobiota bacterium]